MIPSRGGSVVPRQLCRIGTLPSYRTVVSRPFLRFYACGLLRGCVLQEEAGFGLYRKIVGHRLRVSGIQFNANVRRNP